MRRAPSHTQRPRRSAVIHPAAVGGPTKAGAASLSIVSNSVLIAIKIAAGAVTGSIAIVTEAVHSSIDLIASVVALLSVRKADQPADEDHMYGHAKVENLTAALEGILILVGAGVIVYESVRRLAAGSHIEAIGVGIAVMAISCVANIGVSTYLFRQARRHDSPALEGDAAHLRADALTSGGVLGGLVAIQLTGWVWLDSVVALIMAGAVVYAGIRILSRSSRVLVDEALPADEMDIVRGLIQTYPAPELRGFHKLRGRRAGSRRYIDVHLQFGSGTSLERAHVIAHELQAVVEERLSGAEMLIHMEPS